MSCKMSYIELTADYKTLYFSAMFLGCINLSFAYVEGESLLMALKDVAISSGRSVVSKKGK